MNDIDQILWAIPDDKHEALEFIRAIAHVFTAPEFDVLNLIEAQ
jgi:hypothetical protein